MKNSPNLKSQIPNSQTGISNLKSQISNLRSQISNFKFQILKPIFHFSFFIFHFLSLPAAAGNDTTTYRRTIERVTSLDPIEAASVYAARCVGLVYEPLLEYAYGERPYALQPCLAKAMPEISPDGLVYSFSIETNAFFTADPCFGVGADGAPLSRHVTAEDFVYSLKRLADAKLASSGYWLLDGRVDGIGAFREASKGEGPTDYGLDVPGLRAPASDRLEIRLSAPSPVFLWQLAMPYTAAVPREAVEFYGDKFRDHPVGTGPYALAKWRRNYSLRFRRNPLWRGWNAISNLQPEVSNPQSQISNLKSQISNSKTEISNFKFQISNHKPQTANTQTEISNFKSQISKTSLANIFDELYFPTIDDPSTQWLSFLAGELDLQGEIPRDNWDDVVAPDGTLSPAFAARGMTLERAPTLEVGYIGINMRDPLLGKNKKLRQALNAAFDQTRWERFNRGRAIASNGPVPPGVAGADTSPLPSGRGVEAAKRLLAEAGFPDGVDPSTGRRLRLVLDVGRTTQEMRESTELVVAFMDACGIELVPEYNSWPAFLKKVSEGRSQLFRIAWVGDYPDAENFLQLFYGPNASPGPNRCNYVNPEYDDLFRRAMAAPTEKERLELYGAMQRILKDDCPWIFVSHSVSAALVGPRVSGYRAHDFPYGMEKHLRLRGR